MANGSSSMQATISTAIDTIDHLQFLLVIGCNVADLLLHLTQAGDICVVVKGVASSQEQFRQVAGDLLASNVRALCQIWKGVAIYHWHLFMAGSL